MAGSRNMPEPAKKAPPQAYPKINQRSMLNHVSVPDGGSEMIGSDLRLRLEAKKAAGEI